MTPESTLVVLLGRTDPTPAELERAAVLLAAAPDLEAVRRLVRLNKVYPAFAANLRRLPAGVTGEAVRALAGEATHLDLDRARETTKQSLALTLDLLGRHGERAMAIKGSGLLFLLPDYRLRSLGDLDLLFPDGESLAFSARVLQQNGFKIAEGGEAPLACRVFSKRSGEETIVTHFSVYGPDFKLDMHSHDLIVLGCARSGLDYWARGRRVPVGRTQIWVPCPEDALIQMLIHAVDHGYLTVKDCNDTCALLDEYRDRLDWPYLVEQVAASGLDRLFSFLLSWLGRWRGLPNPVPPDQRPRLRPAGSLGRWLARIGLAWRERPWPVQALAGGLLAVEHSRPGARRPAAHRPAAYLPAAHRPAALTLMTRQMLMAARETAEGRWPAHLAAWLLRRSGGGPFFNPLPPTYFPVFLTDITAELQRAWIESDLPWEQTRSALAAQGLAVADLGEARLLVVRAGGREIVVSPAGVFIPTMDFTFDESEFEELVALGTRVVAVASGHGDRGTAERPQRDRVRNGSWPEE